MILRTTNSRTWPAMRKVRTTAALRPFGTASIRRRSRRSPSGRATAYASA